MSRSDRDRLLDTLEAMTAIQDHLLRGPLADGLVFDAVRVRLIEIGEAVKDVDPMLLAQQPQIPWRQVSAMRDQLTHRYFDTACVRSRRIHADSIDAISEVVTMERILIRNLPPGTKTALRARAEQHHRSVEAEVREILADSLEREPVTITDMLSTDEGVDIEFEPERLGLTARTPPL